MEKNLQKKKIYIYIYMYIYLNHFDVHLKLTQHCKSTILQLKKHWGGVQKKSTDSCHFMNLEKAVLNNGTQGNHLLGKESWEQKNTL